MSTSERSPRANAAAGEMLPRPEHGHRLSETEVEGADLHPSWLKTWRRLRAELAGNRQARVSQEPVHDLQDKIAHTPATTLAGLQAQAELIAELAWNDVVASTARQLIAGLKRQQRDGRR